LTLSECKTIENKLAFHTAPALLGIKCANLVSISRSDECDIYSYAGVFNNRACAKGLKMRVLCRCRNKNLVIIYNERLMEKQLSDMNIRQFLLKYGYGFDLGIESCLEKLAQRIYQNNDFPHEIGIFLGYPIEDVIGFIENKGNNYKLCGYWKVYNNVEKAKLTFENYNKCRKFLCNKLNKGIDFYQALKIS
jgi:hypothetical protein